MRGLLASPHAGTCGSTRGFMNGCRCWNTVVTGTHEIELRAPIPHFDQRALQRAAAEQRRIGLQRLEIAADGDRFGDHGAVVEHKRRKPLHRIDCGESFGAMLLRANVDLLGRNLDALLGEEDAHPPRVGRAAAVVELHSRPHSYPVDGATLSRPIRCCQHAIRPRLPRPPPREPLLAVNRWQQTPLSLVLRNLGDF